MLTSCGFGKGAAVPTFLVGNILVVPYGLASFSVGCFPCVLCLCHSVAVVLWAISFLLGSPAIVLWLASLVALAVGIYATYAYVKDTRICQSSVGGPVLLVVDDGSPPTCRGRRIKLGGPLGIIPVSLTVPNPCVGVFDSLSYSCNARNSCSTLYHACLCIESSIVRSFLGRCAIACCCCSFVTWR